MRRRELVDRLSNLCKTHAIISHARSMPSFHMQNLCQVSRCDIITTPIPDVDKLWITKESGSSGGVPWQVRPEGSPIELVASAIGVWFLPHPLGWGKKAKLPLCVYTLTHNFWFRAPQGFYLSCSGPKTNPHILTDRPESEGDPPKGSTVTYWYKRNSKKFT